MGQQSYEVATLDEIDDGAMREVLVDGEPVLLARTGDRIDAVAAICPHAGARLIEGVRSGDRIICPWHKAAFCLRTGALLEPPAVDRLDAYESRIEGRIVRVSKREPRPAPPSAAADERCFVIVGAGAAGALAAQTLREEGFSGRLIMLDAVNRVPYDRTVLSKYALSGEQGAEKTPLQTQSFYREHLIERRAATVRRLDPGRRRIECADGSVVEYDVALLATGAIPVRPRMPGAELGGVFVLRARADADAILARAEQSARAVILGASFIAMEVAASLRERGLDVTVVGREKVPFAKLLGPRVGGALVALHQARGVSFHLGTEIEALAGEGFVREVRLAGGLSLPADLVVVGFGVTPATDYLEGIELAADGGVPVDARLLVAAGLYAAGDIARFPLGGDGPPIRVEHWRVAEQHGRIAALNMLGQDKVFDAVPVFWTIQFMKQLVYIGHAGEWDRVVLHGDPDSQDFLAYYVKDGVVRAAAGMGRDRDAAALIELFGRRCDWTPEALGAEPVVSLEQSGR